MKTAIYTRVSTKTQNTERQLNELEEMCLKFDWIVQFRISDIVSGSVPYRYRKGFAKVVELATERKIEMVAVHEISRLGRNTVDVLKCIQELNSLNVSVHIMNIDLTIKPDRADPSANLIVAVLASLATHEKELMQQRIISGIKASPKKSGRRKGDKYDLSNYKKKYPVVVMLLLDGYNMKVISELTKVSYNTVRRINKLILQDNS